LFISRSRLIDYAIKDTNILGKVFFPYDAAFCAAAGLLCCGRRAFIFRVKSSELKVGKKVGRQWWHFLFDFDIF